MSLVTGAPIVVTDSGRVREETSYFGIPCITEGANTERSATLSLGTNVLTPLDEFEDVVASRLAAPRPARASFPLWDWAAAGRVVADIAALAVVGMCTARFGLAAQEVGR